MDHFLETLQNTDFAQWVQVSQWFYPILLTAHSVGLALLVGVLIIIDLRIVGLVRAIPLMPLNRLMWLVWGAFAVNLGSGVAIFTSDAVKFYHSTMFRLKLSSIVLGVIIAALLASKILGVADRFDRQEMEMPRYAKTLAALSILLWLAAISTGRYMAYE
jgi:diacylglycerol kinase